MTLITNAGSDMARRKISWADWGRGALISIRNGTGMNPIVTQRIINEVHDDRVARYPAPSRDGGYYSRARADGSIDVFIGPDGDITSERPHVHVVHSPPEDRIILTVTDRRGRHTHQEYLPATASGNEVNAAVDRLRRRL
ncbi:MAG: hypothetical protein ACT4RN_01740 [Pseudonocardia sp.]